LIDRYIRPLRTGKIGTLSYSDPETGSHFWYPVSSGAERVNGGFRVRKKASWTTSGGFADFYVVQTTSPDFTGYNDLSVFDIDKGHTTRKRHVDVGLRVADYPTIQDYVGEAVIDTNASRLFVTSVAQAMDRVTDDNTKTLAVGETARADYLHWAWQVKFVAA